MHLHIHSGKSVLACQLRKKNECADKNNCSLRENSKMDAGFVFLPICVYAP